jgi:hypothetical protein
MEEDSPSFHLRHRWVTFEAIGRVVTQRCAVCSKTRVRVPATRPDPPSHRYL